MSAGGLWSNWLRNAGTKDLERGCSPYGAMRRMFGGLTSAPGYGCSSARTFASHQMKDATELAVGVASTGFQFDGGCCRQLLGIA